MRHKKRTSKIVLSKAQNFLLKFNFVSSGGRNITGRITVRHKGSSLKKKRTSSISIQSLQHNYCVITAVTTSKKKNIYEGLLKYANGAMHYNALPFGLKLGSVMLTITSKSLKFLKLNLGTTTCLMLLAPLTLIFNLTSSKAAKIQYAKAAGVFCQIIEIDEDKNLVLVELPTKIKKWVNWFSTATTGRASNVLKNQETIGKAGHNRLLGVRPTVRGVAMNPVDHPHGGRTKTSSPEVTPWGRVAKYNR